MSVGRVVRPNAGMPAAIAPDITNTTRRPAARARREVVGELHQRGLIELARGRGDRRRADLDHGDRRAHIASS